MQEPSLFRVGNTPVILYTVRQVLGGCHLISHLERL
nr:MAG TPA: hypothetical protein [Caudoviricetes sp.]